MLLENIPCLRELTTVSVCFRVIMAMLCGGILGYGREKKRRPAGLRTYLVVCVGSALAMMTGVYLHMVSGTGDAGRIAAQVISGIGFLGAGTILVTRYNQVKGLTTAAGLWAVACIGLALGAGFYTGAIAGFLSIWMSLGILSLIDNRIDKNSKVITLYVEFRNISSVSAFLSYVRMQSVDVRHLETTKVKNVDGSSSISAVVELKLKEKQSHSGIVEQYGGFEGILFITEV